MVLFWLFSVVSHWKKNLVSLKYSIIAERLIIKRFTSWFRFPVMWRELSPKKALWWGRKDIWKRKKKCWLPGLTPFPRNVFNGLPFKVFRNQDCVERFINFFMLKALTLSRTSPSFYMSTVQVFCKHWEKEKLLVTSNFSFFSTVLYLFGEMSAIFIKLEIVVYILFQFGSVWNLSFGKGLNVTGGGGGGGGSWLKWLYLVLKRQKHEKHYDKQRNS